MNNKFILDLAQRCGARVVIFVQEKEQPWCEAFVANWIRRRCKIDAQGMPRSLFDGAKSHMFRKDPAANGAETWAVNTAVAKTSKFAAMQEEFRKTGDATYIAHGGWKHRDDQAMNKRPATLSIKHKIKDKEVGAGGAGVYEMLREIKEHQAIASIGVGDGHRWSHAVGVDFRPGQVAYFDPQLGEITFSKPFDLIDWWADCRAEWEDHIEDKDPNAFNVFPEKAAAWATLWTAVK